MEIPRGWEGVLGEEMCFQVCAISSQESQTQQPEGRKTNEGGEGGGGCAYLKEGKEEVGLISD